MVSDVSPVVSERKTNIELYSGGVFDISREAAIWIWSIFWEG